jgi:uncharacterized protein
VKNALMKRRSIQPFQVKEVADNGGFSGYGSVFGVKDWYGDIVIKGAFSKSLEDWDKKGKLPKMLWQHDTKEPIGVYSLMKEDGHGLYVEGKILIEAGTTEKRAHAHLKAGSIDSMSIGYDVAADGLEYSGADDAYLLKQIKLWEVSLVTFPANEEATITEVKSAIEGGPKEFERFLREAGLSRSQAKGLMSRGYDGLQKLRDADDDDQAEAKSVQSLIDAMRGLRAER